MKSLPKMSPPPQLAWPLSILLLTSLAGCGGSGQNDPPRPNAEQTLESARALAEQGEREAALAQFEQAIAINPKLTGAHLGAAEIYKADGDYAAAERRYGAAAVLEPQSFDAQYNHGLMLQLLRRYTEAVRAYLRALTVQPNDFNANLDLATAYLQLGEATQAVSYAQRAVLIDPMSGPARVNLAEIYRAVGHHDGAVTEYQQAAELMDLTPEVMLNLADSLGQLGRFPEMANTVDRIIQLQPSAKAYERLGSAQFRQGQYDTALAAFTKAVELDADHYPALNGVGVCLLNKHLWSGRNDTEALRGAVAALRRSLQIERSQPRVAELLARWG
jgi:superkiller protein 3